MWRHWLLKKDSRKFFIMKFTNIFTASRSGRFLLLGIASLIIQVVPSLAQEVSSLPAIPESGINIRIDSENRIESEVSSRFTNDSDLRGLAQTFVWNSQSALTGIGIKVGSGIDWKRFSSPQPYALDIQELDGSLAGRRVQQTLATLPVVITPEAVVPGEYLFIAFPEPILLENGKSYGFHLRPTEVNPRSWLFVLMTSSDTSVSSAYPKGVSCQTLGEFIYEGEPYGFGKDPDGNRLNSLFFTKTSAHARP